LNLWGVDYSASAELVVRRGAALFLGVGVMLLLARDAESSQARTSLTVGMIGACTALALLGVLECALGNLYCMVHNIKKLSKTNLGYEKVQ
jgi:hypothetical protein